MTREESTQLENLAKDIRELSARVDTYHTEVAVQNEACRACRLTVVSMGQVLYGNGVPGIKGKVQSLEESRDHMRWGLKALWGAAVAFTAAIIKLFLG